MMTKNNKIKLIQSKASIEQLSNGVLKSIVKFDFVYETRKF